MKKLIGALSILAASIAGPISASDSSENEIDASETYDETGETDAQYNIWVCASVKQSFFRYGRNAGTQFNFARSRPFAAGSGFGQNARSNTYWRAQRQCQQGRSWERPSCSTSCTVVRFQR